jgi:protein-S-isoprenylcysteine O-methyltransferase Ste14
MARDALRTALRVVVLCAIPFAAAGTFDWPMAQAFALVLIALSVVGFAILDPGLIAERTQLPAQIERTDLYLTIAFVSLLFPVTLVIAGLARRAGSEPFPPGVELAGIALFAGGYAFGLRAMRENAFFSGFARLQAERGQRVIDSGPYALVRHPGYAGAIVAHLGLPLALDSGLAYLPTLLGLALLLARTAREDRMLARGLPGYADYAARVRFRLFPGIW